MAYNTLLQERRRDVHERTAQAIETLFRARVEDYYNELAHHYRRSGNLGKAVTYLQRAGHQAVARSARADAIEQLTAALELLKRLPENPDQAQQELDVQTTLGPALMHTKGYAAPEVEHAYARAWELCRRLGETPQRSRVLWGLWAFYLVRGVLLRAQELGEQLLTLAQRAHDPALLLEAHLALGATLFWRGELAPARAHLEQGLALYDPPQHRAHVFSYGQDPGMVCSSYLAWIQWLLGYPDQALQRSHQALTLAQERSHPFSLSFALSFASRLHLFRRKWHIVQERAETLTVLALEHGFRQHIASGKSMQGKALVAQGQGAEGVSLLEEGLAIYRMMGAEQSQPIGLALLAEALSDVGRTDEGLRHLAEALAIAHRTGERAYEAERHRLRGEILLRQMAKGEGQQATVESEAEGWFQRALEVARHQQAKSWELRAVLSLSRLWQCQGRHEQARQLLVESYGWFTEGFDTADLQEAKALLEELPR